MHNYIRYRLAGLQRVSPMHLEGTIPKSEGKYVVHSPDPTIIHISPEQAERVPKGEDTLDLIYNILPKKFHPTEYHHGDFTGVSMFDNQAPSLIPHYAPEDDTINSYNSPDNKRDIATVHHNAGHLKMLYMLEHSLHNNPEESLGPYHDGHIAGEVPGAYRDKLHYLLHFTAPAMMEDFAKKYKGPKDEAKRHFLDYADKHVPYNPMVADYIHQIQEN
jgi:hypothetical protein